MAQTPEAKVKKKVKQYLTTRGIYFTMPFTAGFGANGVPDILVCYQGKFIAIAVSYTHLTLPTNREV